MKWGSVYFISIFKVRWRSKLQTGGVSEWVSGDEDESMMGQFVQLVSVWAKF